MRNNLKFIILFLMLSGCATKPSNKGYDHRMSHELGMIASNMGLESLALPFSFIPLFTNAIDRYNRVYKNPYDHEAEMKAFHEGVKKSYEDRNHRYLEPLNRVDAVGTNELEQSFVKSQESQAIVDKKILENNTLNHSNLNNNLDTYAFSPFIGIENQSSATMKLALIYLSKAQGSFLRALEEDELAIATEIFVENLESGKVLGDDDMEKILIQSKENQRLINKRMTEIKNLSSEARIVFAKGISNYSLGMAALVGSGFLVSNIVNSFSRDIESVFLSLELVITTKDALLAIPLFFSSSSKIIKFAHQNGIDTNELEKTKFQLGF